MTGKSPRQPRIRLGPLEDQEPSLPSRYNRVHRDADRNPLYTTAARRGGDLIGILAQIGDGLSEGWAGLLHLATVLSIDLMQQSGLVAPGCEAVSKLDVS